MADISSAKPEIDNASTFETVADRLLNDMRQLTDHMDRDRTEIDRLKVETEILKAETERLESENRETLVRLRAAV